MEYSLENVDWLHSGAKFFVGLVALFLYALYKYIGKPQEFGFGVFIKENRSIWTWASLMLFLVLVLTEISPDLNQAIKAMVGLDIENTTGSFFLLGWTLSSGANEVVQRNKAKRESKASHDD